MGRGKGWGLVRGGGWWGGWSGGEVKKNRGEELDMVGEWNACFTAVLALRLALAHIKLVFVVSKWINLIVFVRVLNSSRPTNLLFSALGMENGYLVIWFIHSYMSH